jgi:hypothetical protein
MNNDSKKSSRRRAGVWVSLLSCCVVVVSRLSAVCRVCVRYPV